MQSNFTGMMWLMEKKDLTVEQEITTATNYYKEKYGVKPNVVWVNSSVPDLPEKVNGAFINKTTNIGKKYIWVGMQDNE